MNTSAYVWKEKLIDYVIAHGGQLVSAVVIVIVGLILARWIGKLTGHWLDRKAMEPPLQMLLTRMVRLLVAAITLVVALGTAGMDVTALIAGIGVAGVGLGLALQGVLGNLMAGLTVIWTKPFRIGDYIELAGVQGQVQTIALFTTTLVHSDLSRVVIPNRKIVGEILHNYGTIRQLDLSVGVAYGTNINDAVAVIRGALGKNPRVLKAPAPVVGITVLADSTIVIAIKPWTTVADVVPARAEIYQAVVEQFRAGDIQIPFPQREVRMLKSS